MAQYDLNLRDYWRVIKKRKFIIIFTVVAMGVFSLLFSLLWQPVPLYKATASIKVEKTGSVTGLYIQTVSWSQTDYMQTQAAIIKSYYIMEIVAKKLGLIPPDLTSEEIHASKKYQITVLNLRNSVETEQEGFSNILNISVTSTKPKFTQQLANMIAQVYKEQHVLDLNRRTFDAKKFIEGQLVVVRERLRNAEEAVKRFREEKNLISLSSQTSTMLSQFAQVQAVYEKATASRQKVRETIKLLQGAENKPLTTKSSFYIDEASTLYKSLNDQLVRLMLERDTLLLTYTDEYPRVLELNKKIRETMGNLKAHLLSQDKVLSENMRNLESRIDYLDKQIKMLPEQGLELERLEEKIKVNKEIYVLLEKKYQEALIKEAEKIEEVKIVKPALEPNRQINPPKSKATAAVGTILGLILGVVFAFVVETFDTSVAAIEEVEELIGVHALGIIPHVNMQEIKSILSKESPGDIDDKTAERYARLVSHFAPKSTLAESYRALRTNINFSGLKDDIKTIAFTSASPQEGKSSIVTNLALTMAQDGKRVLLIDGDMRRPVIYRIFGIDQAPGLSDIILGSYSWKEVVKTTADIMMGKMSVDEVMITPGMDNLHIITSGTVPPNPAELMSTDKINEIISEARAEYDLVLWDAPPVLSATDAAILASRMEGVVLVYRVGKVGRNTLKRAKAQLDNVKAKVIGVVLNGLKAEISPDFTRQDYYTYHSYYGDEGQKRKKETLRGRLTAISASMSTFFRKDSEKKSDKKSSPVKLSVLLIILLLLIAAVIYQLGYLKLPRFTAVAPAEQQGNPSSKEVVKNPAVKKIIVSDRKGLTTQQFEIVKSDKKEISHNTKEPVSEKKPISSSAGNVVGEKVEKEKKSGIESKPLKQKVKIEASDKTGTINVPRYALQIGSFRNGENAKRLAARLRAKGVDAGWIEFNSKKSGTWYVVLIGQFDKWSESVSFMKAKGLEKEYPGCCVFTVSSSR